MSNLAPIIIFSYKRKEHLQKTIEALKKNDLASNSELIVFSDGPKSENDSADVNKVRKFLKDGLKGFSNVQIIERTENFGLSKSIITGVDEILKQYGKIIVLEDDLETSRYFLKYMNDALDFYQTNEKVGCIHGYFYPTKTNLPETFFLRGADCWGWATWRGSWKLFNSDSMYLLKELKNKHLLQEFDGNNTFGFKKMLNDQAKNKNQSWAIRWHASLYVKNKYTLYPGNPLVRNIGHDLSGTHCEETEDFYVELANEPVKIKKQNIETSKIALNEMKQFFKALRPPVHKRIKSKLESIFE